MRTETYSYLQTAPAQYINRVGIIAESGKYIKGWGDRALICGGVKALKSAEKELVNSLDQNWIKWEKHVFKGECSVNNISTIKKKAEEFSANVIIGVGGGKALDTAKAVAEECGVPVVTIPTIAATCAATTAISIIYNEKGQYENDFYLKTNPDLVLVDPEVIAKAPEKYLQSGIFDALSKWYEGKAAVKGIDSPDVFTSSAMSLARMLNEKMEEKALAAVNLVKENQVGEELIEIIDLNIFLTGVIQSLGMATCRGAAAHAIHNGLTLIPESHELLHGIKVAYGIAVQLYMEELPQEEIDRVIGFFKDLGIETSFSSLNLPYKMELIEKVAEKAANDPIMDKMPMDVNSEMVITAIKRLEEYMNNL